MPKSKPLTRKEIEAEIANLKRGCQKLSKDMQILANKIGMTNGVMREFHGIILAMKAKGLVSDDDISQALINARPKAAEGSGVQSEEAGEDADSSGRGERGVLRNESTDSDSGSESVKTERDGEASQGTDARRDASSDTGDNVE